MSNSNDKRGDALVTPKLHLVRYVEPTRQHGPIVMWNVLSRGVPIMAWISSARFAATRFFEHNGCVVPYRNVPVRNDSTQTWTDLETVLNETEQHNEDAMRSGAGSHEASRRNGST